MFLRIKKNSASLSVTIVRILFNLNFLDTWYVHWVIWNTTKRNYFLLILPVNNNYNSYTCLHSWYLHWCLVSNTHEHFLQRLQWNWWVSKNIRKAKHASCSFIKQKHMNVTWQSRWSLFWPITAKAEKFVWIKLYTL